MPRILKSVASTTKEPRKIGSIYTSALIHKMPPGVPRYLAQRHAEAKREVFEASIAWSDGFKNFSATKDMRLQNAMDNALEVLRDVEAEIALFVEKKRGKK